MIGTVLGSDIETAPRDKSIIYVWDNSHTPIQACWYYPRELKKTPELGEWLSIYGKLEPLGFEPLYWAWPCDVPEVYRV